MENDHHLVPPSARDAAQYVAAMRALRARTGLSYRQLERRASQAGDVLPTSTLSTALSRDTLPREQIVAAFIRACGGDKQAVTAWITARADLAAASAVPASDTTPDPGHDKDAEAETAVDNTPPAAEPRQPLDPLPPRPTPLIRSRAVLHKQRLVVVAGSVICVLTVALVLVLTAYPDSSPEASPPPSPGQDTTGPLTEHSSRDHPTGTPSFPTTAPAPTANQVFGSPSGSPSGPATVKPGAPAPPQQPRRPTGGQPASGQYRIHLAHTNLCVGEGSEKFTSTGRIVLGQQECATASPPTILERQADGTYRIKLNHPQYGIGCTTVDYGGTHEGLLLAGDDCGAGRADQTFTLQPVTTPTTGYLLRSKASDRFCIGVYRNSYETGVQLIQDPCTGSTAQVFVLEHV